MFGEERYHSTLSYSFGGFGSRKNVREWMLISLPRSLSSIFARNESISINSPLIPDDFDDLYFFNQNYHVHSKKNLLSFHDILRHFQIEKFRVFITTLRRLLEEQIKLIKPPSIQLSTAPIYLYVTKTVLLHLLCLLYRQPDFEQRAPKKKIIESP